MRLIIQPDDQSVSLWAAHYVAAKIKAANPTPEKPFVLGCPTGSSPLGMYKALIDLNKKGIVSFQNVVTFNMDEYVGLPKEHPESYYSFTINNPFFAFFLFYPKCAGFAIVSSGLCILSVFLLPQRPCTRRHLCTIQRRDWQKVEQSRQQICRPERAAADGGSL